MNAALRPSLTRPGGLRPAAEALASTLPPLVAQAERVAATITQGVHGRRRVGSGDAFWQYRRYQEGDSIQRIDWRPSAKSSHLFVREREWEAAQSIWIWSDPSASMNWRSAPDVPLKTDRAALLALALGSLAIRGGERVASLDNAEPQHRPIGGRMGLHRLAQRIDAALEQKASGLPHPRPLNRHAKVILISDFLDDVSKLDATIRAFAAHGISGHLMQVLDPGEEHLPFEGRIELSDPEGPAKILLGRADHLRDEYRARLLAHRAQLAQCASAQGWSFSHHITNTAPQTALLALYIAVAGTGAQSYRTVLPA